jgi:ABC-type sulfate/molybdate transport systems ATPase subunit
MRPAILIADRLLEGVAAASVSALAEELYRVLRVIGCTVIAAPASRQELAFVDRVIILDGGRVDRSGTPASLFRSPGSEAAARATGECDSVPVTIRGNEVSSPIGTWTLEAAPFQGGGVALVRPDDFRLAGVGEESDVIVGIEEAGFDGGRWLATGLLTGGVRLRVALDREELLHKGRLLALRYDPSRFTLLPGQPQEGRRLDGGIPALRETR